MTLRADGVDGLDAVGPPAVSDAVRRALKRQLDVAGALTLLVLLSPLIVLVALVVATTSRGPVLYRQARVGRGGVEFDMLKFRSMRDEAERDLARLRRLDEADGPLFKIRRDPRVTPVGHWLRRLSLDELPQLLNVLDGSMSLVGPRPALPAEVSCYEATMHRRHQVRPGLTGLWQVNGRSDLAWEDAVRFDLHYVDHWSLRLDLLILLRTIPAVLGGRGAY